MKKFLCAAAFFAILCVSVLALPAMANQPEVPADGLMMDATDKPVVFNHSTHTTVECAACHHPVDGVESYASCSSAGCHDNLEAKQGVDSYYAVMHKKNLAYDTCISCHEVVGNESGDRELKKNLTACARSACHP